MLKKVTIEDIRGKFSPAIFKEIRDCADTKGWGINPTILHVDGDFIQYAVVVSRGSFRAFTEFKGKESGSVFILNKAEVLQILMEMENIPE